jgi:hypothetical protein
MVTADVLEIVAERIEAKPTIQAVPGAGVSAEELKQGNAVLNQWLTEHYDSDIAERAKARYSFVLDRVKDNWRDKSFWFKILPPGARSAKWTQYKKPSDALESIAPNPAWGYRGIQQEFPRHRDHDPWLPFGRRVPPGCEARRIVLGGVWFWREERQVGLVGEVVLALRLDSRRGAGPQGPDAGV